MVVYISLFIYIMLLSLYFNLIEKRFWNLNFPRYIYILLIAVPLIIVQGLRSYNVGTDTENYYVGYRFIANNSWDNISDVIDWEWGYILLNKISAEIFTSYSSVLIISSAIIVFLTLLGIKSISVNIYFSVVIWITYYLYFASFNGTRQFIAISIIFFATKYIINRNFVKFLLSIMLAGLFHSTSLILLPIYFLWNKEFNFKVLGLLFLLVMITSNYLDQILNYIMVSLGIYDNYLETNFLEESGYLTTLIAGSIFLFVLLIKKIYKINNNYASFYLYIAFISFSIAMLSQDVTLFNRLGYYFNIYTIVIIPYFVLMLKLRLRIVISALIILIFTVYFYVRLFENWQRILPYDFINF